jgi:hypothetical protein
MLHVSSHSPPVHILILSRFTLQIPRNDMYGRFYAGLYDDVSLHVYIASRADLSM